MSISAVSSDAVGLTGPMVHMGIHVDNTGKDGKVSYKASLTNLDSHFSPTIRTCCICPLMSASFAQEETLLPWQPVSSHTRIVG